MASIGFQYQGKSQDDSKSEKNQVPVTLEEIYPHASSSHLELIEKISKLASVIIGKDFSSLSLKDKQYYLTELVSSVSLETELTVKNKMLMERNQQ